MKTIIFSSFLVLILALSIPQISAQTESFDKVNHKMVQVTIDSDGNVSVIHQIRESIKEKQLDFIDGTVSNLKFINEFGMKEDVPISDGAKNIVILPNQGELFVTYDLDDALMLKEGVWTLDFRYLETTTFIVPEEVDLFFVNDRPVVLDEKNGFTCHGCQMVLEYSINEPRKIENVNWESNNFVVEFRTHSEIENFEFNQPSKEISFDVKGDNKFVTVVIPLELLWEPYSVFLDNEKIFFNQYINNGTHVMLNLRPDMGGQVSIIGTTVVPEFPIIAPLAIGFLMIMLVPLVRKFSLH